MTFGATILKKKPTRTKRIELNLNQLKDIIVAHLYATSILNNNDDVLELKIETDGVYHKGTVPIELKIRKGSLK